MNAIRSANAVLLISLALIACTTGPEIRTNAAPNVDLRSYKTFAFMEPLGTDKAGYSSLVSQQLKASSRREMERLGYRYDEQNADLMLNFNAKLSDKLRVYHVPVSGYYGYYGYRTGYYGAWPAYYTSVDQYSEGTLNVDVVDARRRQLVWEGVAVHRVTTKDKENVGHAIDSVITALFAKFPGAAPGDN